ncbi:hypothetical protein GCM10020001_001180 [Nonomuraea salmonea]
MRRGASLRGQREGGLASAVANLFHDGSALSGVSGGLWRRPFHREAGRDNSSGRSMRALQGYVTAAGRVCGARRTVRRCETLAGLAGGEETITMVIASSPAASRRSRVLLLLLTDFFHPP